RRPQRYSRSRPDAAPPYPFATAAPQASPTSKAGRGLFHKFALRLLAILAARAVERQRRRPDHRGQAGEGWSEEAGDRAPLSLPPRPVGAEVAVDQVGRVPLAAGVRPP